jgi:hypothetical protein
MSMNFNQLQPAPLALSASDFFTLLRDLVEMMGDNQKIAAQNSAFQGVAANATGTAIRTSGELDAESQKEAATGQMIGSGVQGGITALGYGYGEYKNGGTLSSLLGRPGPLGQAENELANVTSHVNAMDEVEERLYGARDAALVADAAPPANERYFNTTQRLKSAAYNQADEQALVAGAANRSEAYRTYRETALTQQKTLQEQVNRYNSSKENAMGMATGIAKATSDGVNAQYNLKAAEKKSEAAQYAGASEILKYINAALAQLVQMSLDNAKNFSSVSQSIIQGMAALAQPA